jgi:glycosyltransferase involved in cell wall biosynthesis
MKFDFYLSEMSVSDLHGGGLTLQRVIGDDLDNIQYFAHVNRFAYDLPSNEKYADRNIDLTSIWDKDLVRTLIGNTLSASISEKPVVIKKATNRAARILDKKFEKGAVVNGLICPQGMASIYTLEKLKQYRQVKYISWVMDDHLVQFVKSEWHYPKGVEPIFKKHLQEADHVFVISKEMQEFYKERFGVASTVLFGPADSAGSWGKSAIKINNPLRIGYFGAVAAWQLDALQSVAAALHHTDIQLHIYSGIEKLPDGLNLNGVLLKQRLNPHEVLPAMRNYDAILLPVSFLEKMRSMSAFNIATKMSEYLASGVPIIAVGPGYAAMINYLKINNAAIVVESNEESDIKNAFGLLQDQQLIDRILLNAKHLIVNETGTLAMQKRWVDGLNKA